MTESHAHVSDPLGRNTDHDLARYRFECADVPDPFVVTAFEAVEALNQPYRATIRLHAEHEATDCYELLGRDVALSIAMSGSERFFRGLVDRVTIHHEADRCPICTITVVPAFFALSRSAGTRIFQDQTALEIVQQVLGESLAPYGRAFRSEVDSSRLLTRNYCVQYRESNLDFVHRLLEEEGIGYYFVYDDPELLVLFDDNASLARGPNPETQTIRFGATPGDWSGSSPLVCFPVTYSRTSTAFSTRDYDWRLGSRGTLEYSGALESEDSRRAHEVYEQGNGRHHVIHEDANILLGMLDTAATSLIGANIPTPMQGVVQDLKGTIFDRFSSSNTEDRGRVRSQQLQRDARVFEGVSLLTGLAAGTAFELAEHPRQQTNGEYYVTRIVHSSAAPSAALIGATAAERLARSSYHNRIHCLPRSAPWRPDPITRKPRIDGVQTATVTGPPGLDVFTDPFGRIKVRFPWDRSQTDLIGEYTCWLRVSQAWAGPTAPAFLFIPRIGMEVVVSFVDGDPDRPLVTGCVYNGDNATPALLPPQMTKSIIRTRTIPLGMGYNELSFEDALGFERVYLRAEKDFSELVQHNHDVRVERNEMIAIGENQTSQVGRDRHIEIGRHFNRTVNGRAEEVTGSDHTRIVRGTSREEVSQDYTLNVDGVVSTRCKGQVLTYGRHAVTVMQGDSTYMRMSDEDGSDDGGAGKGLTLMSEGSKIHITKDRIEITVGGSTMVLTPETIQANDKTLPAPPGAPAAPPPPPSDPSSLW